VVGYLTAIDDRTIQSDKLYEQIRAEYVEAVEKGLPICILVAAPPASAPRNVGHLLDGTVSALKEIHDHQIVLDQRDGRLEIIPLTIGNLYNTNTEGRGGRPNLNSLINGFPA
jgi:hypothetical protein